MMKTVLSIRPISCSARARPCCPDNLPFSELTLHASPYTSGATVAVTGPAGTFRKRGRTPGRPPLDPETVSAAQKLIEAGLSPGQAAKQLGIGRATAYRIAKTMR